MYQIKIKRFKRTFWFYVANADISDLDPVILEVEILFQEKENGCAPNQLKYNDILSGKPINSEVLN